MQMRSYQRLSQEAEYSTEPILMATQIILSPAPICLEVFLGNHQNVPTDSSTSPQKRDLSDPPSRASPAREMTPFFGCALLSLCLPRLKAQLISIVSQWQTHGCKSSHLSNKLSFTLVSTLHCGS